MTVKKSEVTMLLLPYIFLIFTLFANVDIISLNFQIGVISGSVEHHLGMRIIGSKGEYQ